MKKKQDLKSWKFMLILIVSVLLVGCSQSTNKPTEKTKNSVSKAEQNSSDVKNMLKEFGTKYLNYDSIDERNESIKDYFTKEAQEANSFNVKVNADVKSRGKITGAYQDISNKNQYLLQINQDTQGSKTVAILKLTVTEDKISKMNMFYVQSAYGN